LAQLRISSLLLALVSCTGTLVGSNDEGNLPGDDEPITESGMRLQIDEPVRGAMIPAAMGPTVHVAGRVLNPRETDVLTIDGQEVAIGAEGAFATDLTADVGLNILVAELRGVTDVQARAQRSFLFGDFASPDDLVRSAVALRINREGFDDGDGEQDDLSSLVEESLAARNLIGTLPTAYQFDAAVVGTVNVALLERTAGRPLVDLVPQNGGVSARVTLQNVRIRHEISFGCLFTTCSATGTATADAVVVTGVIDMALEGKAITASTRDATIDLVNFRNEEDGTIASLAQSVLELFVPDLERRIEELLQPAVAQAARADFALAVSALRVPTSIDLAPLDAQLEVTQEFDALDFAASGAIVGLGVRMRAAFAEGDLGLAAPGWFKWGGTVGDYRLEPAFAASSSVDLANQLLFATWGQGALVYDVPAGQVEFGTGSIGEVHVSSTVPPVVVPAVEGGFLRAAVGDVLLDTTIDGEPLKIMCSIVGRVVLSVDLDRNVLTIELAEAPVIYAEMLEGPEDLPGGFFSSLVEELGPESLSRMVGSIPIPLPVLPLDAVAESLRGKVLSLAPPAEVVGNEPAGRVTLYGRFVAR
jgi:hypothetical protein